MAEPFEIIDVDYRNVDTCGYCGANSLGHARKREWIRQCLPLGLRYKTIVEPATGKTTGMIEYMPAESAWRAVQATNHLVIHCVQVPKKYTGQGLGSRLIQECIRDAQRHSMDGVVALATSRGWCADERIFLKNGFEVVDQAAPALKLVALRLRESVLPTFGDWERRAQALGTGIFMYNSKQCPFMRGDETYARKTWLKSRYGLDATVIEVNDCRAAQANPCVWGTAGIVCNGEIINYVPGGDAHLVNKLKRLNVIR
jgi:L-amino acid N-acyltransferase YncA